MKKFKWIIPVLFLVSIVLFYFWKDTTNPYAAHPFSVKECDFSVSEETIPKFDEVVIAFKHHFDANTSLPVMASCLIDINNDGVDEIFIGGGNTQSDALFQFVKGHFIDISKQVKLPVKTGNSLGAVSYDFDQNGFTDLILTRDTGVYVLLNNKGVFLEEEIEIHLNTESSPLSVTLGDINKDGHIDMFVAGYIKKELMQGQTIFNDKTYGGSSVLLLNNGDNTFKDITQSAGIEYVHNTFQAIFVDVNKDNLLDLVVAYDTGEPRIYVNKDGLSFELKDNPLTGKFSYPMGIAVGDYNNNQSPDFFFSNTGTSVPKIMAKGDLTDEQELFTDWILLNNDGKGSFTDTSQKTKIAKFEFSWGALFEDFNLDGRQDLVVAENYIAFPPQALFKLPCRFLLQQEDGTFAATEQQAGVINKNYAITPLSSDFNDDGYPDLVYINLNGQAKAYINQGGEANYIKVQMADKAKYIGATIDFITDKKTQTNYNIIGEGLCSDQSNTQVFGFSDFEVPMSIRVTDVHGEVQVFKDLKSKTTIVVN